MPRDYSPVERCRECGTVTAVLVYDQGIGEDGEPYKAIYRDRWEHGPRDCARMLELAREEWPTLF